MNNGKIVGFAKETLGCNCPEDVFNYITRADDVITDGFGIDVKINIGNRLLVYIIKPDNEAELKSILPLAVKYGKAERDGSRFNRLRLVFVTDRSADKNPLQQQFAMLIGDDDKIHLHFIDNETLQSLK